MPLPLTTDELANRLRDYSRENYLLLANVIKGVVLGAATASAISIVTDLPHNLQKIPAFACSCAAAFITYITWTRGVLLTNSRSNTRDAVLPLLMGGVEVSLFGVLFTSGAAEHFPAPWQFWFFVLALHTWFAVRLVTNRLENAQVEDFDAELHKLKIYEEYLGWMRDDIKEAGKGSRMALGSGALTWALWLMGGRTIHGWTVPTYLGNCVFAALAIPPLVIILLSTRSATRQLRDLDMTISNAIRTSAKNVVS